MSDRVYASVMNAVGAAVPRYLKNVLNLAETRIELNDNTLYTVISPLFSCLLT